MTKHNKITKTLTEINMKPGKYINKNKFKILIKNIIALIYDTKNKYDTKITCMLHKHCSS